MPAALATFQGAVDAGALNTITLANEDGWKLDVEGAAATSGSGTDTTGDTDATTP